VRERYEEWFFTPKKWKKKKSFFYILFFPLNWLPLSRLLEMNRGERPWIHMSKLNNNKVERGSSKFCITVIEEGKVGKRRFSRVKKISGTNKT